MIAGLVLAAALAGSPLPDARLAAANALLEEGDVEGAARGYETLLAQGLESPALHVNLGAAHLRAGRRGAAVASWLRALRLDPGDADARANLALVRARGEEGIGGADRAFLARVVARTPDGVAAAAFLAPWLLLWALLASLVAAPRARRPLALAAVAAGALALAGGALVAGREAERGAERAVVIAPGAALRDGPEEALRPALRLDEGTEVRVLETRSGAARVRVATGVAGWVREADLERL